MKQQEREDEQEGGVGELEKSGGGTTWCQSCKIVIRDNKGEDIKNFDIKKRILGKSKICAAVSLSLSLSHTHILP